MLRCRHLPHPTEPAVDRNTADTADTADTAGRVESSCGRQSLHIPWESPPASMALSFDGLV